MRAVDADELKKGIVELCGNINANKGITIPTLAFIRLIDNADTVEPEKILVANVTFDKDELEQIVRDRVIEPIKNGELVVQTEKRPTGEWIYGEDDCGQDGWFCSECDFFVPWYYEYYEKDIDFIREYKACPHCLAEMVTYTGKDRDTKGGTK